MIKGITMLKVSNPLKFKFKDEKLNKIVFTNPLDIKFKNETLNKPAVEVIKNIIKNDKIQCKDHTNLEHVEFRNNEIYCKTCSSRLKLVQAWMIPDAYGVNDIEKD